MATVFSAAGPPPHTRAARSFMRQCASADAARLFDERRAEDRDVLRAVGADHVHLGEIDALYPRRSVAGPIGKLGELVPELVHRYPTYRFDIAKGRVSGGDRGLVRRLGARVGELAARIGAELVFCPAGVGRHVDHLITRAMGQFLGGRVVYYSDFPYNQSAAVDSACLGAHRLVPWTWGDGIDAKKPLIRGYASQVDALSALVAVWAFRRSTKRLVTQT